MSKRRNAGAAMAIDLCFCPCPEQGSIYGGCLDDTLKGEARSSHCATALASMVLQLNQRKERDLSDGATFLADTKRVERERRVSAKKMLLEPKLALYFGNSKMTFSSFEFFWKNMYM
jgi:hypothetical protein